MPESLHFELWLFLSQGQQSLEASEASVLR